MSQELPPDLPPPVLLRTETALLAAVSLYFTARNGSEEVAVRTQAFIPPQVAELVAGALERLAQELRQGPARIIRPVGPVGVA